MSFIVPKTNNYFGFIPATVGPANVNFQTNLYLVSSSEGAISANDVCVQTSLNTVRSVSSTGAFQAGLINARSNMALSGVTSTLSGVFHVISLHPVEGGVYSTVAAGTATSSQEVRKWLGYFIDGVGVPSTNVLNVANTTS